MKNKKYLMWVLFKYITYGKHERVWNRDCLAKCKYSSDECILATGIQ